jgi:hypothetical protein
MNNDAHMCKGVHELLRNLTPLHFPFDSKPIPANGIYILFETGEYGHGTNRIVRIGTHTGDNQLRSRLQQHFLLENKDRSIFRKNIGRTILAKNNDPFLDQWNIDLTTRKARTIHAGSIDLAKQLLVKIIRICFFALHDPPSH